jgi:hypothetical protein
MSLRDNQLLEKINSLTKEVILTNNLSKDTLSNNNDKESFGFNKPNTLMQNPLFKEKLSSVFSEITSKKSNKNSNKTLNINQSENTSQNNQNIIYDNEKRNMLNKKKEEIMNLLNPLDAQLNKNRRKKVNKTTSTINKPFFNNNEVKFSERVRNELNKILYKAEPQIYNPVTQEGNQINSLNNKSNLQSGKDLIHRRNTSSSLRSQKQKDTNSVIETINKLKIQYGI